MYRHFKDLSLTPITIMIEGNTFFEEFTVRAGTGKGEETRVNQAEVLVYNDEGKVKDLRLYFDRLELADVFAGPLEKPLVKRLSKASLKGLI
jgi:hypothetical protein